MYRLACALLITITSLACGDDTSSEGTYHELTVNVTGTGTGRVVSGPAGIDCGEVCSAPFEAGQAVGLSVALSADSYVVAWSGDCRGEPDGSVCGLTMDSPMTIELELGSNPVTQIAAGGNHACALMSTHAVRCWGIGEYGQLGYGNTENVGDDEVPADAGDVDVGGTVMQIALGGSHSCALLDTGDVRCWGSGEYGQLGYGNTENIGDDERPSEAGTVNVGGTVVQIAAGFSHTCALLDTGDVRCWGSGEYGQLGYGNTETIGDDEVPASAGSVDVGGEVIQFTAGGHQTCALLESGGVRCWGFGINGELGYGNPYNIGDNETPASAGDLMIGSEVAALSGGVQHTCVLLASGGVRCWGSGEHGQLGYGNTETIGDDETPGDIVNVSVGMAATQVSAGGSHTCVVVESGGVRCWGSGSRGQLGYASTASIGDDETPDSKGDIVLGGTAISVAAGGLFTCALLDVGSVRCWGSGGSTGYGSWNDIGDDETPASVGDVQLL